MLFIHHIQLFDDQGLHPGAVVVNNGKIVDILSSQHSDSNEWKTYYDQADEVVDGNNCWLLPGVIDTHVHFREPGLTRKADIASESRAAAAGGVTTVLDMPNVIPTTTTPEALQTKADLFAQKSVVNYGLFYGITQDNISEALTLDPQTFCGYKVFLGSSTGGMLMNNPTMLHHLFSNTQRVIAVHSESEDIIRANAEQLRQELHSDDIPVTYHPRVRSREACIEATEQVIKLAEETGAQLHVCHITTAEELALINRQKHAHISAEACVAHLWFCDADYETQGTRIKCNPAIKSAADRDALRQGLTDGNITLVATDHAPHQMADKNGGALKAASGMPSIQYSLLTMLELMYQGICRLNDVVRLMCHAPAERYGIAHRGYIRVGYHADFVLLDPEQTTMVTPQHIESTCGWSPFEGQTYHHRVTGTWVNGQRIFDGDKVSDLYRGESVRFDL